MKVVGHIVLVKVLFFFFLYFFPHNFLVNNFIYLDFHTQLGMLVAQHVGYWR